MEKTEIKIIKISKLKKNPKNPRVIKDENYKKLITSIKEKAQYMYLNPVKVDVNNVMLGGNQRLSACIELKWKEIPCSVFTLEMAEELNKEAKEQNRPEKTYEEYCDEVLIMDNSHFGDWDNDILDLWTKEELSPWNIEKATKTETQKLSELKFESIYFEPKVKPEINLIDCVNLEKFEAKLKVINDSKLTKKQKEVMKYFAYRFIKIDFENVANYYAFNAKEEEKEIIERLRLVLVDGGIDGFIEDDLLKIMKTIEGWDEQ